MSIQFHNTPLPDPLRPEASDSDGAMATRDLRMVILDQLITSGLPILYGTKDFEDFHEVGRFVKEHRPLRSAMLGVMLYAYTDPCTCCIPAHGNREVIREITSPDGVIDYLRAAIGKQETVDLLFLTEKLYNETVERIRQVSPDTRLIVACDRNSASRASELRRLGIPAINDDDYMRCSPLNAVIALTVFDEMMQGGSLQSQIPEWLLAAYRNTTYVIDGTGTSVRVGTLSPEADNICREQKADSWLFITPYNPRSEVFSRTENDLRMDDLRSILTERGLNFLEGEGQGQDGWEPERSAFVPGVSREFAIELGKRFEQYAVVFGEVGRPAELIEIPLDPEI